MTSPECGFELYSGFFFIHFGAGLALKVFLDVLLERDYFLGGGIFGCWRWFSGCFGGVWVVWRGFLRVIFDWRIRNEDRNFEPWK